MAKLLQDAKAEVARLRATESTFTTEFPTYLEDSVRARELSEYQFALTKKWKVYEKVTSHKLLEMYPPLKDMHSKLVPSRVSNKDFWQRYHYWCDEKRWIQELQRRKEEQVKQKFEQTSNNNKRQGVAGGPLLSSLEPAAPAILVPTAAASAVENRTTNVPEKKEQEQQASSSAIPATGLKDRLKEWNKAASSNITKKWEKPVFQVEKTFARSSFPKVVDTKMAEPRPSSKAAELRVQVETTTPTVEAVSATGTPIGLGLQDRLKQWDKATTTTTHKTEKETVAANASTTKTEVTTTSEAINVNAATTKSRPSWKVTDTAASGGGMKGTATIPPKTTVNPPAPVLATVGSSAGRINHPRTYEHTAVASLSPVAPSRPSVRMVDVDAPRIGQQNILTNDNDKDEKVSDLPDVGKGLMDRLDDWEKQTSLRPPSKLSVVGRISIQLPVVTSHVAAAPELDLPAAKKVLDAYTKAAANATSHKANKEAKKLPDDLPVVSQSVKNRMNEWKKQANKKVSKTKSEVVHDAQVAQASSLPTGRVTAKFDRKAAQAEAVRRCKLKETYLTPLQTPNDSADTKRTLSDFLFQFRRNYNNGSQERFQILQTYPDTMAVYFRSMVPRKITEKDFWERYYFRCDVDRILADATRNEGKLGQLRLATNDSQSMASSATNEMAEARPQKPKDLPPTSITIPSSGAVTTTTRTSAPTFAGSTTSHKSTPQTASLSPARIIDHPSPLVTSASLKAVPTSSLPAARLKSRTAPVASFVAPSAPMNEAAVRQRASLVTVRDFNDLDKPKPRRQSVLEVPSLQARNQDELPEILIPHSAIESKQYLVSLYKSLETVKGAPSRYSLSDSKKVGDSIAEVRRQMLDALDEEAESENRACPRDGMDQVNNEEAILAKGHAAFSVTKDLIVKELTTGSDDSIAMRPELEAPDNVLHEDVQEATEPDVEVADETHSSTVKNDTALMEPMAPDRSTLNALHDDQEVVENTLEKEMVAALLATPGKVEDQSADVKIVGTVKPYEDAQETTDQNVKVADEFHSRSANVNEGSCVVNIPTALESLAPQSISSEFPNELPVEKGEIASDEDTNTAVMAGASHSTSEDLDDDSNVAEAVKISPENVERQSIDVEVTKENVPAENVTKATDENAEVAEEFHSSSEEPVVVPSNAAGDATTETNEDQYLDVGLGDKDVPIADVLGMTNQHVKMEDESPSRSAKVDEEPVVPNAAADATSKTTEGQSVELDVEEEDAPAVKAPEATDQPLKPAAADSDPNIAEVVPTTEDSLAADQSASIDIPSENEMGQVLFGEDPISAVMPPETVDVEAVEEDVPAEDLSTEQSVPVADDSLSRTEKGNGNLYIAEVLATKAPLVSDQSTTSNVPNEQGVSEMAPDDTMVFAVNVAPENDVNASTEKVGNKSGHVKAVAKDDPPKDIQDVSDQSIELADASHLWSEEVNEDSITVELPTTEGLLASDQSAISEIPSEQGEDGSTLDGKTNAAADQVVDAESVEEDVPAENIQEVTDQNVNVTIESHSRSEKVDEDSSIPNEAVTVEPLVHDQSATDDITNEKGESSPFWEEEASSAVKTTPERVDEQSTDVEKVADDVPADDVQEAADHNVQVADESYSRSDRVDDISSFSKEPITEEPLVPDQYEIQNGDESPLDEDTTTAINAIPERVEDQSIDVEATAEDVPAEDVEKTTDPNVELVDESNSNSEKVAGGSCIPNEPATDAISEVKASSPEWDEDLPEDVPGVFVLGTTDQIVEVAYESNARSATAHDDSNIAQVLTTEGILSPDQNSSSSEFPSEQGEGETPSDKTANVIADATPETIEDQSVDVEAVAKDVPAENEQEKTDQINTSSDQSHLGSEHQVDERSSIPNEPNAEEPLATDQSAGSEISNVQGEGTMDSMAPDESSSVRVEALDKDILAENVQYPTNQNVKGVNEHHSSAARSNEAPTPSDLYNEQEEDERVLDGIRIAELKPTQEWAQSVGVTEVEKDAQEVTDPNNKVPDDSHSRAAKVKEDSRIADELPTFQSQAYAQSISSEEAVHVDAVEKDAPEKDVQAATEQNIKVADGSHSMAAQINEASSIADDTAERSPRHPVGSSVHDQIEQNEEIALVGENVRSPTCYTEAVDSSPDGSEVESTKVMGGYESDSGGLHETIEPKLSLTDAIEIQSACASKEKEVELANDEFVEKVEVVADKDFVDAVSGAPTAARISVNDMVAKEPPNEVHENEQDGYLQMEEKQPKVPENELNIYTQLVPEGASPESATKETIEMTIDPEFSAAQSVETENNLAPKPTLEQSAVTLEQEVPAEGQKTTIESSYRDEATSPAHGDVASLPVTRSPQTQTTEEEKDTLFAESLGEEVYGNVSTKESNGDSNTQQQVHDDESDRLDGKQVYANVSSEESDGDSKTKHQVHDDKELLGAVTVAGIVGASLSFDETATTEKGGVEFSVEEIRRRRLRRELREVQRSPPPASPLGARLSSKTSGNSSSMLADIKMELNSETEMDPAVESSTTTTISGGNGDQQGARDEEDDASTTGSTRYDNVEEEEPNVQNDSPNAYEEEEMAEATAAFLLKSNTTSTSDPPAGAGSKEENNRDSKTTSDH